MLRRNIPLNYRNITGTLSSRAGDGSAPFESPLERDFLELLRFDEINVDSYDTQQPVIYYVNDEGYERRYTPDIFVKFKSGRLVMFEVKPRDILREKWAEFRPRFKQAIRYGKKHGYDFRIITDLEIRTPYLKNVKFLSRYKRLEFDPRHCLILEKLQALGVSSPAQLIKFVAHSKVAQAELLPTLWALVANFKISVDLSIELTMDSQIFPAVGEEL